MQVTDFQTIARQAAQFIMPEGIVTLFACAALVLDVMLPRNRKRVVGWVTLAGAGFALISLWIMYTGIVTKGAPRTAFYDMIVLDSYAVVFKSMFLIGAALSILLSMKYLDVEGEQRGQRVPTGLGHDLAQRRTLRRGQQLPYGQLGGAAIGNQGLLVAHHAPLRNPSMRR